MRHLSAFLSAMSVLLAVSFLTEDAWVGFYSGLAVWFAFLVVLDK